MLKGPNYNLTPPPTLPKEEEVLNLLYLARVKHNLLSVDLSSWFIKLEIRWCNLDGVPIKYHQALGPAPLQQSWWAVIDPGHSFLWQRISDCLALQIGNATRYQNPLWLYHSLSSAAFCSVYTGWQPVRDFFGLKNPLPAGFTSSMVSLYY